MNQRQKIILIITLATIGIALIVASIVGFTRSNTTTQPSSDTYVDPGSGETIVNNGKSRQGSEASLKNSIVYLGFSKLIDRGLSPVQIQSIQSAFKSYSLKQTDKFKEVSLTVDSIRHLLPQGESTTHTITFTATANRKISYFVTVEYSDTTSCITTIRSDDKSTILFTQ